jgi:hypothetical protein
VGRKEESCSSLLMSQPLMISSLIRHADKNHGDTESVSRIKWQSVETRQEHNSYITVESSAEKLAPRKRRFGAAG